jgi:phage terminase small subunit
MSKPRAQNHRQARFAHFYVRHHNGSQAAREAGYSARGRSANATARRLLAHPLVMERIYALEADTERALEYDKALVLEGLLDVFAIAKENRKPSTMIAAAREIGKVQGFLPAKPTQKVKKAEIPPAEHNLMSLTDAQLLALIQKGKKAAS